MDGFAYVDRVGYGVVSFDYKLYFMSSTAAQR